MFLPAFFMIGCASSYKHSELQTQTKKLDSSIGVVISIPEDGWYENTQYHNSGQMTALMPSNAIKSAFSKHAKRVDIINECIKEECLEQINNGKYGYYVKPVILHWEERATEWSGKPDRIEISLVVFDTTTKEELANFSYTGKSKWATLGGDHPQDLLPEPTNEIVGKLYK